MSMASLTSAQEAAAPIHPEQLGPFPVGVTTTVLVDHSRTDEVTKSPRTLVTEIWYPAADEAKSLPKNRMTDFLFRGQAPAILLAFRAGFKVKVDDLDARYQNHAIRDARVRDGSYPLIIFSHGNGGLRFQSTFWCDHLASHGYMVMSCDHTGNAAATVVNGKIVLHDSKSRDRHAVDRPKDVAFLIDSMTRFHKGEDSRFAGRVKLDQVAVAGHSFGGYTCNEVISMDDRVKAIVPMTPVFRERKKFDVPLLLFVATEDATIGLKGNENARKYYEESTGPKYLVEIKDAGHFSFSDMGQFRPDFGDGVGEGKRITKPDEPIKYLPLDETYKITNAYSVAFLGRYLKGDQSFDGFLGENHYPSAIEFKRDVPVPTTAGK
jgi:predicted dienelactone hydrolase